MNTTFISKVFIKLFSFSLLILIILVSRFPYLAMLIVSAIWYKNLYIKNLQTQNARLKSIYVHQILPYFGNASVMTTSKLYCRDLKMCFPTVKLLLTSQGHFIFHNNIRSTRLWHTLMPLHTPKTLETSKKMNTLFD